MNRLLLNTSLDLFADFDEFDEPTLDWRNTFSWRLTGGLSVDYNLDILEQPQVTDETQITQSLLFRYSWGSSTTSGRTGAPIPAPVRPMKRKEWPKAPLAAGNRL